MLISLAIQNNSTGSVLTNGGTLDAEIRELKPGVAAPTTIEQCKMLKTIPELFESTTS